MMHSSQPFIVYTNCGYFSGSRMDGYIPLLRGSVSQEEPPRAPIISRSPLAHLHHEDEVPQRARRPHTED